MAIRPRPRIGRRARVPPPVPQLASYALAARKLVSELPSSTIRELDYALAEVSACGPSPRLAGAIVMEVPSIPPAIFDELQVASAAVRGEGDERDGQRIADRQLTPLLAPSIEKRAAAKMTASMPPPHMPPDNSEGGRQLARAWRSTLPIDSVRPRLLAALASHPLILLSGGTGSGKTSRVPQFLLEAFLLSHQPDLPNADVASAEASVPLTRGSIRGEPDRSLGTSTVRDGATDSAVSAPAATDAARTAVPTAMAAASMPPWSDACSCRIVVVQPRRISAIAGAARVASEMGSTDFRGHGPRWHHAISEACKGDPGGLVGAHTAPAQPPSTAPIADGRRVGYTVRHESRPPSRTERATIEFVTAGVMLRRLASCPALGGVSHLVVDEIHERSAEMDLLVEELRASVLPARPDLKVRWLLGGWGPPAC